MSVKNSKKRIALWTAGAVLVAGLVSVGAQSGGGDQEGRRAGRPHHGRRMGPGLGLMHGLRTLDLTDAQREQIRGIMQNHREEIRGVATEVRTARRALHGASAAESVDQGRIEEASRNLAAAIAKGATLRAQIRNEVFQVLTPEQQQKAKELRERLDKRIEERVDDLIDMI